MARRRSPGGRGGQVNLLIQLYLQHMLATQRQEGAAAADLSRMQEQQKIDTAQSMIPGIRDRSIDSRSLPPDLVARLGVNPEVIRGTDESAMLPFYEQTRQAKTQVEVPTIESLLGGAKARGVETTPQIGSAEWRPSVEGELPSATRSMTSPPALQQAFDQRKGQLASINTAQELELDRGFAQARGDAYNTAMGTEAATEENFPAALNRSTLEEQNKFQLDLQQRGVTDPLDVTQTGREATATALGQTDPEVVRRQIDKFEQEEAIREQHRPAPRPTDAMARAQGMAPILFEADRGIRSFEDREVDLGWGTQFRGQMPGLAWTVTAEQKQLLQHARNYVNIANLILTGVQGREQEYDRFIGTYVGVSGEDRVTRMQKRRARELFNRSVLQRAQSGVGGTLEEIMNEVDAQSAGAAYPGEPSPLTDGIPETDIEAIREALELSRQRR